jgi:hypothetical protein
VSFSCFFLFFSCFGVLFLFFESGCPFLVCRFSCLLFLFAFLVPLFLFHNKHSILSEPPMTPHSICLWRPETARRTGYTLEKDGTLLRGALFSDRLLGTLNPRSRCTDAGARINTCR